jgi:hypothetical protein
VGGPDLADRKTRITSHKRTVSYHYVTAPALRGPWAALLRARRAIGLRRPRRRWEVWETIEAAAPAALSHAGQPSS